VQVKAVDLWNTDIKCADVTCEGVSKSFLTQSIKK
jgi:hypothetical protein